MTEVWLGTNEALHIFFLSCVGCQLNVEAPPVGPAFVSGWSRPAPIPSFWAESKRPPRFCAEVLLPPAKGGSRAEGAAGLSQGKRHLHVQRRQAPIREVVNKEAFFCLGKGNFFPKKVFGYSWGDNWTVSLFFCQKNSIRLVSAYEDKILDNGPGQVNTQVTTNL